MSRTEAQIKNTHGVASRTFDHMYDTTYTLASSRDLDRANRQAIPGLLKQVPDSKNMFSVLAHHPAVAVVIKPHDPLPVTIPRNFQDRQQMQQSEALHSYHDADPQGRDRYKYRARPIGPATTGSFDQQQKMAFSLVKFVENKEKTVSSSQHSHAPEPKSRTVFVQTDFRENDTQTDPWTPEYVLRPGSAPEILTLASLSYGHGLPAGLAEVEMIERAREKRKWLETLPEVTDETTANLRLQMMEDQEMREWRVREEDIERLQAERMELFKKLLAQRDESKKLETESKLDKLYSDQQLKKSTKLEKLHSAALKTVRSLGKQRANVEDTFARRDIIESYENAGSAVYAPVAREGGSIIEKQGNQYVVDSYLLKTYQGLLELEASLPQEVTQPRITRPALRAKPHGKKERETQRLQESLKNIDQTLKLSKSQTIQIEPPPRFLQAVPKPPVRPSTPSVDDDDDDSDLPVIALQQFLRGRAIQNEMFEGKERRQELIDELRSTHALRDTEKEIKQQQLEEEQRQHNIARHEQDIMSQEKSIIAEMQGANVGEMLDFLSKELVRLQEERRIHAFAMMAERERRMREAEESGKRQIEEARRRQQDEVFRQVVKVHQASVDSYLEDIMLGARAASADNQARVEIRKKAAALNQIAQELFESGYDKTELGAQAIVADLVSSFLLPEVKKQSMRQNVAQGQRKFIQAAHKEIFSASNNAAKETKHDTRSSLDEMDELFES